MDDYIERGFALDVVKRTSGDYVAAWAEIAHAPAADVAPVVHARWADGSHGDAKCPVCGREDMERNYNYCPHCGAKMDG